LSAGNDNKPQYSVVSHSPHLARVLFLGGKILIRLSDVYVKYGSGVEAVSGVSLTVNTGEFLFVVGPSGAGKSTIARLLTAEIRPSAGVAMVNGFNINRLKRRTIPALRRTVGVVFQDFRLIERMTAFENVAFALRVTGVSTHDIKKRVPYVLGLVGLSDKANSLPKELSGGEQQRVAIARALVNNPQVVIADEPTGNLDPEMSFDLLKLFGEINSLGTTTIVITHDKTLVDRFQKRVVTLSGGVVTGDRVGGYNAYAGGIKA